MRTNKKMSTRTTIRTTARIAPSRAEDEEGPDEEESFPPRPPPPRPRDVVVVVVVVVVGGAWVDAGSVLLSPGIVVAWAVVLDTASLHVESGNGEEQVVSDTTLHAPNSTVERPHAEH